MLAALVVALVVVGMLAAAVAAAAALPWLLSLSMMKNRQTRCGVTSTVGVTKGEEPMGRAR